MSRSGGRHHVRTALATLLPSEHAPAAVSMTELFGSHLDDYAEIIVGPHKRPIGFMTRGEDNGFTDKVQLALRQLGLPEAALAHHRVLSEWFEHLRAFFKIEWHVGEGGVVEPLAACYFRRRPSVDDVVTRLARWGVGPEGRELVFDVARRLEKDTVHFVSSAFRPERGLHHKLYFSQWVTPERRDLVTAHIARVFEAFGYGEQLEDWRKKHEWSVSLKESTLFVSISFSSDGSNPSFKIDYPGIGTARAALWLKPADQAQVIADGEDACALAAARELSFLGVRYRPGSSTPSLKYYCDVPRPQE